MAYSLKAINDAVRSDPKGFAEECDAAFAKKLHSTLKDGGRFIIAHNESRQSINERHKKTASHVSDILSDAKTEAKIFEGLFDIDITADTDYLYVISGRKI